MKNTCCGCNGARPRDRGICGKPAFFKPQRCRDLGVSATRMREGLDGPRSFRFVEWDLRSVAFGAGVYAPVASSPALQEEDFAAEGAFPGVEAKFWINTFLEKTATLDSRHFDIGAVRTAPFMFTHSFARGKLLETKQHNNLESRLSAMPNLPEATERLRPRLDNLYLLL